MNSRFVRVGWGLSYTDALLHISNIKAYIQSIQKNRTIPQLFKMDMEIAITAQDGMEDEIKQTIRTCDDLTRDELREYLNNWIPYFKYYLNNSKEIEILIENHNDKAIIELESYVKEKEDEFKQTENYKNLKHLDFYEVDNTFLMALLSSKNILHRTPKRLVQYRRYYEIEKEPDLIDIDYLPNYLQVVRPIISRCVEIAEKRMRWLTGEMQVNSLPKSKTKQIEIPKDNSANENKKEKLRTNLSVKQIAYLFKIFQKENLIKPEIENTELAHFIKASFTAKQSDDISLKNIINILSAPEKSTSDFWIEKSKNMALKAREIWNNFERLSK